MDIIDDYRYELLKEHLNLCQILQLYQRLSYGKIDLNELFDLDKKNSENSILAAILSQTNMASASALTESYLTDCQKVREIYNEWL